ncbi:MAG: argininosuccinate lyase, partial [Oscillospiraceae bacterium]
MAKMWAGRFSKEVDTKVNDFNSSISFDARMYKQDIKGSIAHAVMLGEQAIIPLSESKQIVAGLEGILADIDSGKLQFDPNAEDIHMFVEAELTARLGDAGKRLHTARSRNDQVALDIKMYLKDETKSIIEIVRELISVICELANDHLTTVMPGYTHLQRAQPITFSHHIMAYAQMLLRDLGRLCDTYSRMDTMPLGSGALASTTYPIDRQRVCDLLGFSE